MTLAYNVNVSTSTAAQTVFTLLDTLLDAGWTVPRSSDGTTYNASGNQISSGGSGAGGLNNNYAWFVVRDPGGRREYCFQRSTSAGSWRVAFSELARFTGNSPDATVAPSATDSQNLIGGGTDASPTYATTWLDAAPSGRAHAVAESAPTGDVYPFYLTQTYVGTGALRSFLIVDALTDCEDDDVSRVVHVANSTIGATMSTLVTSQLVKTWTRFGLSGAAFSANAVAIAPNAGVYIFGGLTAGAGGVDPYTSKDKYTMLGYAVQYSASVGGYKGRSSGMVRATSIARNFPNTLENSDADNSSCYFGSAIALRWPTGVTPTI